MKERRAVRVLDQDYAEEVIDRLGRLSPAAEPAWGRMTPPQMVAHLGLTVRYSMGKFGPLPVVGPWWLRRIVGPLVINGFLALPKNAKAPRARGVTLPPPDDLESLQALLEEYLGLVQAGELTPPPHPYFGDIGIDGWAKFHVVHFEHHLRQFRL